MEFLDSNAFEQMAKEYNNKYYVKSSVHILEKQNESLIFKTKNIFFKIFNLFENLKFSFGKNKHFQSFFENYKELKKITLEFFKKNFNEEFLNEQAQKKSIINHKICANTILEIYIDLFSLNCEFIDEIKNLKNKKHLSNENYEIDNKLNYLLENYFYLQEIFKNYSQLLKYFYLIVE